MSKRANPVLSIGMIVKNEEKKLEKCLQALQPLRDSLPCELVIADTGSTDNTRAIAEQYADLVFDFPWVNDFSAARNAVMDKCSGLWYLTVDADEYLDANVSELVTFLTSSDVQKIDVGYIIVRNYNTNEMRQGDCTDFLACRMIRMATGIRYAGSIHEAFSGHAGRASRFFHATVLHHDGYAWLTQEDARAKLQRNLSLLEKELEKQPNNARILMECIESSNFEPEKRRQYSLRAMELLKKGNLEEDIFAPLLARDACMAGAGERYPETVEWIAWAQKHFPDSAFIRIDVSFAEALQAHHDQDHAKVIQAAEKYKTELRAFSHDRSLQAKTLSLSPLQWAKAVDRQILDLMSAEALAKCDQAKKGWALLRGWEFSPAMPEVLADWVRAMTLMEGIPGAEEEVLRVFQKTGSEDDQKQSKLRHAYVNALLNLLWNERDGVGIFRRLPGLLGVCATFLSETNSAVRAVLLESVSDWSEYPVPLAQAAIRAGLALPDGFYQQPFEKLQDAASLYVSWDKQNAVHVLRFLQNDSCKGARLQFAFMLISAALQANQDLEAEQMRLLCDAFFALSDAYLKWLYNPAMLQDECIHLLPGLHRFTWYVLREQKRLERQQWSDCIQDLRQALKSAPDMKGVVDYLLHQVETQQTHSRITPEMETLAAQIRGILSQYAPDDPAVQMLMASPAYQKVAPLLDMMHNSEGNEEENI